MRTNRFLFSSLISTVALFSCGTKANVFSENLNKGTVTFITSNNKLAMQAYPKDNYQFDGWFLKDDDDGEYRFESASNPYMVEFIKNVTYQAKFEPVSTKTFYFTLEKEEFSQIPSYYSISNFYGVKGQIEDVIIPNVHYGYPVKEIKNDTFLNCSFLKSITIPNNITKINSEAFSGCTGITEITIDHVLSDCGTAFTGWTSDQTIKLSSDCFVEGSPIKTKWGWTLEEKTDYYVSADCGSTDVKIVKIS